MLGGGAYREWEGLEEGGGARGNKALKAVGRPIRKGEGPQRMGRGLKGGGRGIKGWEGPIGSGRGLP